MFVFNKTMTKMLENMNSIAVVLMVVLIIVLPNVISSDLANRLYSDNVNLFLIVLLVAFIGYLDEKLGILFVLLILSLMMKHKNVEGFQGGCSSYDSEDSCPPELCQWDRSMCTDLNENTVDVYSENSIGDNDGTDGNDGIGGNNGTSGNNGTGGNNGTVGTVGNDGIGGNNGTVGNDGIGGNNDTVGTVGGNLQNCDGCTGNTGCLTRCAPCMENPSGDCDGCGDCLVRCSASICGEGFTNKENFIRDTVPVYRREGFRNKNNSKELQTQGIPLSNNSQDVAGCRYDYKNSAQNSTMNGPPLSSCNAYNPSELSTGTLFYPLNPQ